MGVDIGNLFRKEKISLNDLHDRVKINNGNGINYPIKEFNFIIVSGCTLPMLDVLDYLFSNVRSNTKIIIRDLDVVIKPIINLIDSQDNINLIKKIDSLTFLKMLI